jgi:DNA-binding GntR family transcriptional regulator
MVQLRDTIYQSIRRAILIGEFGPGQELRQQVLAERYHTSRSSIRDALIRLEQEKLVTVLPRRGCRVNPITASDAEDVFALRLVIEPACAAAAAKVDDAKLRTLDQFRGFADKDLEGPMSVAHNASFHRKLADLSNNRRISAIAEGLMAHFARMERVAEPEPDREVDRSACAEHEAIIDAIQDHDADRAARLAHDHVEAARSRTLPALRLAELWLNQAGRRGRLLLKRARDGEARSR